MKPASETVQKSTVYKIKSTRTVQPENAASTNSDSSVVNLTSGLEDFKFNFDVEPNAGDSWTMTASSVDVQDNKITEKVKEKCESNTENFKFEPSDRSFRFDFQIESVNDKNNT